MDTLTPVEVEALPPERLANLLGAERVAGLQECAATAQALLGDRTVHHVSVAGGGGGVAESLSSLLALGRGAGIDMRWVLVGGDHEFFRVTKRVHNFLHGSVGDGDGLGQWEKRHYDRVLAAPGAALAATVRPGDLVVLHDPETAGLATVLAEAGAQVVYRSHGGVDASTRTTQSAWSFLRPYLEAADAVVLSRAAYAPGFIAPAGVFVIPPAIDPLGPKNAELSDDHVEATLRAAGIAAGNVGDRFRDFTRRDGSPGTVRRLKDVMEGDLVPAGARYVLQVSRWDRLKDMGGVLDGFVSALDLLPDDVHLVLAGPRPDAVPEDPEAPRVAAECRATWNHLPVQARRRIHLCHLPLDDPDENAHVVNALQRRADLVVHKSLAEGFGLGVAEAMWKRRAVLASRVGGIQDQVTDDENGMLLDDPRDRGALGEAINLMMRDDELRERLGAAARERVREERLGDRQLLQYVELFAALVG